MAGGWVGAGREERTTLKTALWSEEKSRPKAACLHFKTAFSGLFMHISDKWAPGSNATHTAQSNRLFLRAFHPKRSRHAMPRTDLHRAAGNKSLDAHWGQAQSLAEEIHPKLTSSLQNTPGWLRTSLPLQPPFNAQSADNSQAHSRKRAGGGRWAGSRYSNLTHSPPPLYLDVQKSVEMLSRRDAINQSSPGYWRWQERIDWR